MPISGEEARAIRKGTGLTQEQFAAIVGVARGTINRIEAGAQAAIPIVERAIRSAGTGQVRAKSPRRPSRKSK